MSINYFSSAISDSINQVNQEAIRNKQIVGSVVMVAKNREIVYQQASGYANREQKIPMQTDSVFLLSSVTKPIVTAAVLCLVEQGILNLQSPVTDYLPTFTPKLKNGQQPIITLHHLLTHSAGLKYRFDEPYGKGIYNTLQISDGFDQIAISLEENLKRLSQARLFIFLELIGVIH
ncbi:serine hydrolase domain-containing protein [Gilliamella sp. wkB108]|uniref:serine hydrolase domain-containing protein n=1 Tax=Gilliamella sp. wkB108 TaxID=3120256 RepID=UPI0009BFE09B|nr:serine hydrolase domain-containing protein [Gilliamella apicola]